MSATLAGHNRLAEGESNRNAYYYRYSTDAQKRGYVFELTIDEFTMLTQSNCYYCGVPPSKSIAYPGTNGEYQCNGIDRINNNLGYQINNCVSCCEQCNFAKRGKTQAEFLAWVERIYQKMSAQT